MLNASLLAAMVAAVTGAAPTHILAPNIDWNVRAPRGPKRAGPGWTNAHQKRMATKARNVRRHRAAQKG